MRYLYFIEQDDVFKLGGFSDYCTFSRQGAAATDECTVTHLGVFADVKPVRAEACQTFAVFEPQMFSPRFSYSAGSGYFPIR